jgi:hypothetical protein
MRAGVEAEIQALLARQREWLSGVFEELTQQSNGTVGLDSFWLQLFKQSGNLSMQGPQGQLDIIPVPGMAETT